MSQNRRRTRHYIDCGGGATLAVTTRGPLDPRTADALTELGRAVARQMREGTLPPSRGMAVTQVVDPAVREPAPPAS